MHWSSSADGRQRHFPSMAPRAEYMPLLSTPRLHGAGLPMVMETWCRRFIAYPTQKKKKTPRGRLVHCCKTGARRSPATLSITQPRPPPRRSAWLLRNYVLTLIYKHGLMPTSHLIANPHNRTARTTAHARPPLHDDRGPRPFGSSFFRR